MLPMMQCDVISIQHVGHYTESSGNKRKLIQCYQLPMMQCNMMQCDAVRWYFQIIHGPLSSGPREQKKSIVCKELPEKQCNVMRCHVQGVGHSSAPKERTAHYGIIPLGKKNEKLYYWLSLWDAM